jgi:beta-galactosidase
VIYVAARVVDANGVLVPDASNLITFKVTGPGRLVAVDSADNSSHEPFQASARRAYQGLCFAMLRASASSGRITLVASSPGLPAASVNVKAVAR